MSANNASSTSGHGPLVTSSLGRWVFLIAVVATAALAWHFSTQPRVAINTQPLTTAEDPTGATLSDNELFDAIVAKGNTIGMGSMDDNERKVLKVIIAEVTESGVDIGKVLDANKLVSDSEIYWVLLYQNRGTGERYRILAKQVFFDPTQENGNLSEPYPSSVVVAEEYRWLPSEALFDK